MVLLVVWVVGAAPRLAVAGVWGMATAAAAAAAAALVPLMVALLHSYCSSTEASRSITSTQICPSVPHFSTFPAHETAPPPIV